MLLSDPLVLLSVCVWVVLLCVCLWVGVVTVLLHRRRDDLSGSTPGVVESVWDGTVRISVGSYTLRTPRTPADFLRHRQDVSLTRCRGFGGRLPTSGDPVRVIWGGRPRRILAVWSHGPPR